MKGDILGVLPEVSGWGNNCICKLEEWRSYFLACVVCRERVEGWSYLSGRQEGEAFGEVKRICQLGE